MKQPHDHDDHSHSHPHDHAHEHHHSHQHSYKQATRKRLLIALAVNGLVMVAEAIGGYVTGSLALLSDAGHMFTHLFALATSLFAIILASRPVSDHRSYGFFRAEVLASFVNAIFLVGATVWIAKEAFDRILNPTPIATTEMIVIACIGLATNMVSFFLLREDSHSDMNVRSAFLHVLTDTFSSAAIILGGFVIRFTDFTLLDPLLSILIGVLILLWAWRLIRESTDILLEAAPKTVRAEQVRETILNTCPEIKGIHDFHCWVITSDRFAATFHIFLEDCPLSEASAIMGRIRTLLAEQFHITHVNIQVEPMDQSCPHPGAFRKGC